MVNQPINLATYARFKVRIFVAFFYIFVSQNRILAMCFLRTVDITVLTDIYGKPLLILINQWFMVVFLVGSRRISHKKTEFLLRSAHKWYIKQVLVYAHFRKLFMRTFVNCLCVFVLFVGRIS
jgi:hypothetical protein